MASPNLSQTHRSFCFSDHPSSSGGQQGSIGLLLQLDAIPYFWCPPTSLGIVATTGTRYLTATASDSRVHNGRVDHGSLGLNVSNLSRDLVKALPEVGAEGLPTGDSARRSQQALTIHLGLPGLCRVQLLSRSWVPDCAWR